MPIAKILSSTCLINKNNFLCEAHICNELRRLTNIIQIRNLVKETNLKQRPASLEVENNDDKAAQKVLHL